MLLALDLGEKTGWATYDDSGEIESGMVNLKGRKHSKEGYRFNELRLWLDELSPAPTHIVYEKVVSHIGVLAAHCYGGYKATITGWAEERFIPYDGIPVGTIKKFWTGKGNSKKPVMIAEGHKRGFKEVSDDNEMDALALIHYWMEHGLFSLK